MYLCHKMLEYKELAIGLTQTVSITLPASFNGDPNSGISEK